MAPPNNSRYFASLAATFVVTAVAAQAPPNLCTCNGPAGVATLSWTGTAWAAAAPAPAAGIPAPLVPGVAHPELTCKGDLPRRRRQAQDRNLFPYGFARAEAEAAIAQFCSTANNNAESIQLPYGVTAVSFNEVDKKPSTLTLGFTRDKGMGAQCPQVQSKQLAQDLCTSAFRQSLDLCGPTAQAGKQALKYPSTFYWGCTTWTVDLTLQPVAVSASTSKDSI